MITYEQKLDRDVSWAFREGSMHFEKESAVHKTLKSITKHLGELEIPYAVIGGMAMFFHGYRRFTEDVDLLVTTDGLRAIHVHLLGYFPPFAASKQLRDYETGVRVEFRVTGEYPGDGLPKPVAFPNPSESSTVIDGVHFLTLPRLIELKLASGMSNPRRAKDLVDVQALIEHFDLPEAFAHQLNPYVQEKYREIWHIIHANPP